MNPTCLYSGNLCSVCLSLRTHIWEWRLSYLWHTCTPAEWLSCNLHLSRCSYQASTVEKGTGSLADLCFATPNLSTLLKCLTELHALCSSILLVRTLTGLGWTTLLLILRYWRRSCFMSLWMILLEMAMKRCT